MTNAENTPTEPLPAPQYQPAETPAYAYAPATDAPAPALHHTSHHLTGEGVALIVVAALLFGAFAFAVGWFGGTMHARFAMSRGFGIERGYGRGGMMGGFQHPGIGGQGYGQGYGRGGRMRQWQGGQGLPGQPGQQGGQGYQGALPYGHPDVGGYGSAPATPQAQ